MNLDRLLADAKAKALKLAENYAVPRWSKPSAFPERPLWRPCNLALEGFRRTGKATPHDVVVGKALARVLSGGETDMTETLAEEDLLALERRAFLALARHPASIARVGHMLKTGKPLRN